MEICFYLFTKSFIEIIGYYMYIERDVILYEYY